MQGKHVYVGFDFVHSKHVTTHVEHHTTIAETRTVVDFHGRQFNRSTSFVYRNRLTQRLNAIEYSSLRRSSNHHFLAIYSHTVCLRRISFQSQFQYDSAFFISFLYLQVNAGLLLDERSQKLGVLLHLFITGRVINRFSALQQEAVLLRSCHLQRHRHNLIISDSRRLFRTRGRQYTGKCQPQAVQF